MSTATTLIRASEVVNQGIVKGAPIGNRFDASLLAPNVYVAELNYLKPIIYGDFLNDLLSTRNPNDCNYNSSIGGIVEAFPNNAEYETLWKEKLFPFLSRAVYLYSLPSIVMQANSTGVEIYPSQFGQSVGTRGLKILQDIERNTLTTLKDDIVKFLCDNKGDYPLWESEKFCEDCNGCGDCGSSTTSYGLGMITYKTR